MSIETTFKEVGIEASVDRAKNSVTLETNLAAVLRWTETKPDYGFRSNSLQHDQSLISDNEAQWKGGTFRTLQSELRGGVNMRPFEDARAKLARSGLLAKLQTQTQDITPRRKRRMSEHDGEWDYSRRYEITPFQATHKTFSPERTVTIQCAFAISSSSSADEINRFGAMAWAIADLIESSGVRARVVMTQNGREIDSSFRWKNFISVVLKKPGEYVSPSLLATAFSSNFKRRVMHSLIVATADLAEKEVAFHLGVPIQEPHAIKFADGILKLAPDVSHALTDTLEREIMAAISWDGIKKSRKAA